MQNVKMGLSLSSAGDADRTVELRPSFFMKGQREESNLSGCKCSSKASLQS